MAEPSSAVFPKSVRLLNAKDYSFVFSSVDIKLSTQYFLCLARKQDASHSRLGIIVAKKNVRHAVDRNRIKRVLRESYRLNQSLIPNYDLVLMAKASSVNTEKAKLHKELQYVWRKLKQKANS